MGGDSPDPHYDYWALRRNGDYYLRKSLFEDQRDPTAIFFNTRIVRNTELLLYALRLYDKLGIDPSTGFELELRYGGLDGRVLRSTSNRHIPGSYRCTEDQITTSYNGSLQDVEASPDFSHEPVGGGWAGDLASRREWRGHYEAEYRAVIVGCGAERRPGRGVRGGGGSRRGERADRSLRRGEAAGVTVRGWRFLPG